MATRKDKSQAELADHARLVLRAGYSHRAQVQMEVGNVVRAELGDAAEADTLANRLVAQAETDLAADAATWPARTDNDALARALAVLAERGFVVLEHCQDHFDATRALRAAPEARGVVFFTETDVWHAITDGMLELKVWHADTAAVVEGESELDAVLDALRQAGLPAVFDEGRVEVTMTWRRRPPG